ncbi:MAG: ribonuclease HII [Microcystaceae cyanobacterium]
MLLAGVDEVGRGALFGPVVTAAVLVTVEDFSRLRSLGVKDSKQLSPTRRAQLVPLITNQVQSWRIGYATIAEIELLNIRCASLLAMKRALVKLPQAPDRCLVDGRDGIPDLPFEQESIIRGDQSSEAIAAASILAKVWRDELIIRLGKRYPQYGLAQHKGYGTKQHLLALEKYGMTRLHRPKFCRKFILAQPTQGDPI